MKKLKLKSLLLLLLILSLSIDASAQKKNEAAPSCKQDVFAALQPLPKLNYTCRPEQANDYDETILKWPERISAINDFMRQLEDLSAPAWWKASVDDLNLCYFMGRAGKMNEEEREKFRVGDYPLDLLGKGSIRLLLAADPCYQTGYGGSNAFLLYNRVGRVLVTEVLDGYFSRADQSVSLDFAALNKQRLIEVSTSTGGLNPYITNYYFVIDEKTGKAVPKLIFKDGKRLTNKITSAMILEGRESLPKGYAEMEIIKANRLADRFNIYEVGDGSSRIKDSGGLPLQRRVYKWSGQYYRRIL